MWKVILFSYLNIFYKLNSQKATKKIVTLFSTPSRPKKRKKYNSTFQGAIHLNYTYKNKIVAYYQLGKGGDGVLLIHRWGGSTENFKKLIMTLVQNGHTVYRSIIFSL